MREGLACDGPHGVTVAEAMGTDWSTCNESPTGRGPGKGSQEKDPGLEQWGEVVRLGAQPERNFWGK